MSRAGVRIAGGRHRGRLIRVPAEVRPTSGRVREALFSIWMERLTGAKLLDLFAGAGVIALEALSRGAAEVACVDRSNVALGVIAANAVSLDQD
jgi:16S rRNA (guanine966-N2)-methyltransferase